MTNTELLRKEIADSGLKYSFIAKRLGITSYSLKMKIDNDNEFKTGEVKLICDLLRITSLKKKEEIFFAQKVD